MPLGGRAMNSIDRSKTTLMRDFHRVYSRNPKRLIKTWLKKMGKAQVTRHHQYMEHIYLDTFHPSLPMMGFVRASTIKSAGEEDQRKSTPPNNYTL